MLGALNCATIGSLRKLLASLWPSLRSLRHGVRSRVGLKLAVLAHSEEDGQSVEPHPVE